MQQLGVMLAAIALTGCFAANPAISDISESKVEVQADAYGVGEEGWQHAEVQAQAERGCALMNDKRPIYLSTGCAVPSEFGCSRVKYLFACQ